MYGAKCLTCNSGISFCYHNPVNFCPYCGIKFQIGMNRQWSPRLVDRYKQSIKESLRPTPARYGIQSRYWWGWKDGEPEPRWLDQGGWSYGTKEYALDSLRSLVERESFDQEYRLVRIYADGRIVPTKVQKFGKERD
jgi:hypothetical protein